MASIKLTGDTSGEITISAPAVAGTNTLTLPATTGTILDSNSTLSSSNLSGALPALDGSALTGISTSPIVASNLPTSNRGTNGYVKFSGGYTMQWGMVSGTGTATITVSFPVTFTYIYSVLITAGDNGTTLNGNTGNLVSDNTQTTTSQFQFKTGGSQESQYWLATGFIS